MKQITDLNEAKTRLNKSVTANVIKRFSPELLDNREIALQATKINGLILKYLSQRLRDDKEIVFNAYCSKPLSLEFASSNLRKNTTFVYNLFTLRGNFDSAKAFKYIDKELKTDKEFILRLLSSNSFIFEYFEDRFKDDIQIANQALTQNAYNFRFVSDRIKNDRQFALSSLTLCNNFRYFSDNLKNDKEIFCQLIDKIDKSVNFQLVKFASEEIKKDKKMLLRAIKKNVQFIQFFDDSLKKDITILELVFNKKSSPEQSLKDFLRPILLDEPLGMLYCPEEIKEDKELILEIIKDNYCEPISMYDFFSSLGENIQDLLGDSKNAKEMVQVLERSIELDLLNQNLEKNLQPSTLKNNKVKI